MTELGPIADEVAATLSRLEEREAVRRVWERDHTLWQDDPVEVADRLGWLDTPREMRHGFDRLAAFATQVCEDGITDVVLSGMGGSSLFPEVVARTFPAVDGYPRLHVLDSTDPAAVRRAGEVAPIEQILFVVSSKSGTTTETRSHLAYFWEATGQRGDQFVAITDPGTELADLARDQGFRRVFENRPDIGGRFSALSYFGLVPAALAGVDVEELLDRAIEASDACGPHVPASENPGAWLGAVLGTAARAGRDKLTLLLPEDLSAFADWVEQLIAESTGKYDTGIVPVVGEPFGRPEVYGDDRMFVADAAAAASEELAAANQPVVDFNATQPLDLGAEAFRWELATSLAGTVLGINPFDQPDVDAAKRAAAEALDSEPAERPEEPLEPLLEEVRPGDYLAILAYVDPASPLVDQLQKVRVALRDRLRVATSLGIGPRYLHSTGQLHKGGPSSGVFVQVVAEPDDDIPVPGESYTFGTLLRAQAAGDLDVLNKRGRRARRVALDELLDVDT
ncbi:MAG: glucose-6-phosphate isomerase [Actinobacteria bacterium]|nr:glucose-6-phosphate isomerase [Actinomycetota bacterium]